ncbi:MAG: hypothetical protein EXR77_17830 [Myxococcales bacterium]|nr:hypothetical protein [Myxococcales bacterium]
MQPFADPNRPFELATPVLRLKSGKDPNAKWVLWPVFAWRVVVPVPKKRKLDLFERAMLGLARAGVTRLTEMANHVKISQDLSALVVQGLQNAALVDPTGRPTARGIKALEELDDDLPDEMRVGFVLTDGFTGKLWPRFLTGDLPLADVELDDKGRPILLSGSPGDPWRDPTFSVLPGVRDSLIRTRPQVGDVLRAAKRHRRQRKLDDLSDDDDFRAVPQMQRVSFIDRIGQSYQMALRVHRHPSGDWMVDDPFGHGEGVDLRARMEERLDKLPGLRNWLAPLIGSGLAATTLGDLRMRAAWAVEARLTLAIRIHADLYALLVAMQRAMFEAEADDAPRDKWDDVLVKAQRATERVFHTTLKQFRRTKSPLHRKLAQADLKYNALQLDTIAADLGFESPLPNSLKSVRRGKVQFAEESGGGSLRPLVVLALLYADVTPEHPLHKCALMHRDLLRRLDALAGARDQAAHDGVDQLSDRVTEHVETVYAATEMLLPQ